jgi:hypothetical protein
LSVHPRNVADLNFAAVCSEDCAGRITDNEKHPRMFDTKIAVIVRDDLAPWQALNVTAFLMTGIVGQFPDLIGDPYCDRSGNIYNALSAQPIIVLSADSAVIAAIHRRALERNVKTSLYIEEMFSTGHDAANRAVFGQFAPEDAKIVGIALREDKKTVDKITKGAKMYR